MRWSPGGTALSTLSRTLPSMSGRSAPHSTHWAVFVTVRATNRLGMYVLGGHFERHAHRARVAADVSETLSAVPFANCRLDCGTDGSCVGGMCMCV